MLLCPPLYNNHCPPECANVPLEYDDDILSELSYNHFTIHTTTIVYNDNNYSNWQWCVTINTIVTLLQLQLT